MGVVQVSLALNAEATVVGGEGVGVGVGVLVVEVEVEGEAGQHGPTQLALEVVEVLQQQAHLSMVKAQHRQPAAALL